jgi:hypothetical protein
MFFAFVGKLSLKLTNANVGHRLETEDDQICFGEKKIPPKFFYRQFFFTAKILFVVKSCTNF